MAIVTGIAACLSAAALAPAYIGPGAGLGAVGSLLALVGAAALMVIGFVWYPVKRLLEKRRGNEFERAAAEDSAADSGTDSGADDPDGSAAAPSETGRDRGDR